MPVIPLVVTLGILKWRSRQKRLGSLVADRLKSRLVNARPGSKHFTALGLAMLGLALLITALAMPEAGEEWIETKAEGRNILLCVDISQSMLTEDAGAASRLAAAKGAALGIVERFPTDRIGLLVFSGETQVMVPLTIDHSFLSQTITQLNPIDLPVGGSDLALAIKDSTIILNQTGQRNNVMVILSDGEDHSSGIDDASGMAAKAGVFIYTLGFGSEDGDYIRDPRELDGFFRDRRGNKVISQLKSDSLQLIAAKTNGSYSRGVGGDFLGSLDRAVAKMDRFEQEGGHQRIAKPVYQWFLCPGLFFLMLSVIIDRLPLARAAIILAAFVLTFGNPAEGGEFLDTLAAQKANKEGDHRMASGLFRSAADQAEGGRRAKLQMAAGASAYRAEDWTGAAAAFSEALLTEDDDLRREAHYSLANALYYQGAATEGKPRISAWQGAVSHYGESLKLGENQSAAENLALVKQLLQQAEQEQQEKEKQEQEKKEQEDQQQKEEENESDDEQEKNGDQGEEKEEDQENQDNKDESDKGDEKEGGKEGEPKEEEPKDGENQKGENESEENGQPEEEKDDPGPTQEEQEAQEMEPEKGKESPEERARRILKSQADFGGNPPKAQRRYFRRPEKDW